MHKPHGSWVLAGGVPGGVALAQTHYTWSVFHVRRANRHHKCTVGTEKGRAPGFSQHLLYSFAAPSVPCRVLWVPPTPLGVSTHERELGWLTLPAVIFLGGRAGVCLSRPGEVQEVFDSAAEGQSWARICLRTENNCVGSSLLKVSPQEMVQEIHQVLMDREDTCHRTCFSLQLDGNVLDNFAELKTIEGLQEGSLLKVVEGKFRQPWGGDA